MLELLAVTVLFSAINITVMKGVVDEYERATEGNNSAVVQVIECEDQNACAESD